MTKNSFQKIPYRTYSERVLCPNREQNKTQGATAVSVIAPRL